MTISVPTRVAILDQRLSAELLAITLSSREEFNVLWAVDSPAEAARQLQTAVPQVLLVDPAVRNGVREFLRKLGEEHPAIRVLLLTMDDEEQALQSHDDNIAGCLRKTEPLRRFEQAIRHIATGRFWIRDNAHPEHATTKIATAATNAVADKTAVSR